MISSFEVGAIFKVVDQASPAIRKILAEIRQLSAAVERAREGMAAIGKMPGIAAATGETDALAASWRAVAVNAAAAQRAIGTATTASARAAAAGVAGGGRAGLGAFLGGRGLGHGHVPHFGTGAMLATAGAVDAVYQAAELEKAVWFLNYHAGRDTDNPENKSYFRKVLQDSMKTTGFNLHDTSNAAMQVIRMFKGTPGGGVDVLPELLEVAAKESLAKGEGLSESAKSFIGLAHMTPAYTPDEIKKLAPAFAFLSTANPSRLGSIKRAASYAVPALRSGLEVDPLTTLLLGTALTRAGATNTKSGTWLREMALRAMPGTSLMSKFAFKRHEEALQAFGLVGEDHKPTWFTGGKPDMLKMLDIAGSRAGSIPIDKRAAYERALFGAQGGGGFALLADPKVRDQIQSLRKEMSDPAFLNQYKAMLPNYLKGSTVQNARTAVAEFNNTMADLGEHSLPAVNHALRDFKNILARIRGDQPERGDGKWGAGATAIEGVAVGGVVGAFAGGVGAPVGAGLGAVIGGVMGTAHDFMKEREGKWEEAYSRRPHGLGVHRNQPPIIVNVPLRIDLDGKTLADVIGRNLSSDHPTAAPVFDPMGNYQGGDGQ